MKGRGVAAVAGGLAALGLMAACGGGPRLRSLRTGVQRDAAGRPFVEARRMEASGCQETSRGASERDARARLAQSAQAQGYSGVIDVVCAPSGPSTCLAGTTCAGVAVRYVVPRADGSTPEASPGARCEPACTGAARCQDGQCVAACEPPCEAGRVCVQDGTCQPVP
jgi:hypothetical protein